MKDYAVTLQEAWNELDANMREELRLQGRRPNRESEKRVRILLRSVVAVYKAYRDASLADKKAAKGQG